jgi:hypothetical protein
MTDTKKIEAALLRGSPLPLTFTWVDDGKEGHVLRIGVPVQTQAGIPAVMMCVPAGMPDAFIPKAIARARMLIEEIFNANMVGIVFTGAPQPVLAKPQKTLLLPGGLMAGSA